ncbi:hypothetical protein [Desulfatitalea tepidiphila]|uniref:hypothetical protein n=1 Tax=Desulfatitalea tepidiphila TaxID=1185843 RepID=UPI0006B4C183|nr:hypothetical protein [Desulfatitalea tepidiphila]
MTDKLMELLVWALCDQRPAPPVDAAYLYCQTQDNQASVFGAAQSIVRQGLAKHILICDAPPVSGYPGFADWQRELAGLGIDGDVLERVPVGAVRMLHTLIESRALISYARLQDYKTIMIVSSPFHQLRALMTAASVAIWGWPEINIYSFPGVALPWHEAAVHSQGMLQAKRIDLIHEEMRRIEAYQGKGDLASFEEVGRYLLGRDLS